MLKVGNTIARADRVFFFKSTAVSVLAFPTKLNKKLISSGKPSHLSQCSYNPETFIMIGI